MRFDLIDRIDEFEPGKRVVAVKAVSLAEDYLADHFPTFPILPGVMMLEVMVQAGAWLVQHANDFSPRLILLNDARNITYKTFVKPGSLLRVDLTCRSLGKDSSSFVGVGRCNDREVVKGRFSLAHHAHPALIRNADPGDCSDGAEPARIGLAPADLAKNARARFAMLSGSRGGH